MAKHNDYAAFVSVRMRAMKPHGLAEARAAMKRIGAEWRELHARANPKRKPKSGGFDAWQPDLFGGAHKERGEGRTRAEELRLAREEMRDSGSRSLFEHERKENPMPVNPGKAARSARRTARHEQRIQARGDEMRIGSARAFSPGSFGSWPRRSRRRPLRRNPSGTNWLVIGAIALVLLSRRQASSQVG